LSVYGHNILGHFTAITITKEPDFGLLPDSRLSLKVQEMKIGFQFDALWQDISYSIRSLRRNALLSIIVIATFTIGIGINAGVFTLINAIALRARVDKDPDSFVRAYTAYIQDPTRPRAPGTTTLEDYLAFRDRARSLRDVAAWAGFDAMIGANDSSEESLLFVSCNFFRLYGLEQPLLGRLLQPTDCGASDPVVVVSERLWRNRLGADPQIIGKVIHLNGQTVTVIGVTPAFAGQIDNAKAWVPYTLQTYLQRGDDLQRPGESPWLTVEGRLQPGSTSREVAAELTMLAGQQDALHPGRATAVTVTNGSIVDNPRFSSQGAWLIYLILGLLTCVVLLTCTNVTSLLLARADARQQEIAVRLALGAGRLRLFRMLLLETLMLAATAGAVSLFFVYKLPGALIVWLGDSQSDWTADRALQPDWRVFAYLGAITLLAATFAGLAPALQSLKVELSGALKKRLPMFGGSGRRTWLLRLLVGAQVALSLVLLVGAGIFVRSDQQLSSADPGYETRRVLWGAIRRRGGSAIPLSQPSTTIFNRTLAQRLEIVPGVQSVAFADFPSPPLGKGGRLSEVQIPGQPIQEVGMKKVSPGFFATLGIPITKGRALLESDSPNNKSGCPVVVSEELARQFWPGSDPVGKELRDSGGTRLEVVGVARDVSTIRVGGPDDPTLYLPWDSNSGPGSYLPIVRFTGDSAVLERAISASFRESLPDISMEVRTIQSRIDESLEIIRKVETLLVFLCVMAVTLAVIGIYGVVSFVVTRRAKEIGIRVAMGAQNKDIYVAVFGDSGRPVVIGLLIGLLLALAGALMFGLSLKSAPVTINTSEPLIFVVAAAVLTAAAFAAMLRPAFRATHVDPIKALREE
jgi:predicted permease